MRKDAAAQFGLHFVKVPIEVESNRGYRASFEYEFEDTTQNSLRIFEVAQGREKSELSISWDPSTYFITADNLGTYKVRTEGSKTSILRLLSGKNEAHEYSFDQSTKIEKRRSPTEEITLQYAGTPGPAYNNVIRRTIIDPSGTKTTSRNYYNDKGELIRSVTEMPLGKIETIGGVDGEGARTLFNGIEQPKATTKTENGVTHVNITPASGEVRQLTFRDGYLVKQLDR
jgi:hypothetical protein